MSACSILHRFRSLSWKPLCVVLLAPGLVLGGPPQLPGGPPQAPGQRTQMQLRNWRLWRSGQAPRTGQEVILELGTVVDDYKKVLDEWGSIAMAPLMFATADKDWYRSTDKPNLPQHPFALQDYAPDAAENSKTIFTLKGMYDAQANANGQVLTSVRQKLQVAGAATVDVDAVKAVVNEAQMAVFQQDLQNARQGNAAATALAQDKATAAQADYDTAQKNASAAAAAATAAHERRTAAAVDLVRARGTVETVKIRQSKAADALKEAQKADAVAAARLEQLQANPLTPVDEVAAAAAEREQAKQKLAAAEQEVTDAKAAQETAGALLQAAQERDTKAAGDVTTAEERETQTKSDLGTARTTLDGAQKELITTTYSSITFPAQTVASQTAAVPADVQSKMEALLTKGSGVETVGLTGDGKADLLPNTLGGTNDGAFAPMARISGAAAALTVKNILSFLGNPEAAAQFADKRVLFGVTTLSVNPGWRTRQRFKAVIDATVSVEMVEARDETIRQMLNCPDYPVPLRKVIAERYPGALTEAQRQFFAGKTAMRAEDRGRYAWKPREGQTDDQYKVVVHAVSPMVDAQNLDLASSRARQNEFALFLTAQLAQMGMGGAGSLFASWSELRRKDVATRTTVATANSFSVGSDFGFEIGTRLHGVDEEDAKSDESKQVLERQTFPVLLILGMAQDDARPRLRVDDKTGAVWVEEPQLITDFSTRWSRKEHDWLSKLGLRPERELTDGYRLALQQGQTVNRLIERGGEFSRTNAAKELARQTAEGKLSYEMSALVHTKENEQREFLGMAKALEGERYEQSLPAAWLLDNPPTAEELFDPDLEVTANDLRFMPEQLEFDSLNSQRTVLISGAGVEALDENQIAVLSSDVRLVGTAARTQTTLRLDLMPGAAAPAAGAVQFAIGRRQLPGGGALTAALRPAVVTNALAFQVQSQEKPALGEWSAGPGGAEESTGNAPLTLATFDDPYVPDNKGWTHAGVSLLLKGQRLDLMNLAGAQLRGAGLKVDNVTVTVTAQGREAALVTFDLVSKAGEGEFYLEVPVKNNAGAKLTSKVVKFSFGNAGPELKGWAANGQTTGPRLVNAEWKKEDQTLNAQVRLMLTGTGLKQLQTALVRGAFTGTAKVDAHDKALVVMLTLAGVKPANLPQPAVLPPDATEEQKSKAKESDKKALEAHLSTTPLHAEGDVYLIFPDRRPPLATEALTLRLETSPAAEKAKLEAEAKNK